MDSHFIKYYLDDPNKDGTGGTLCVWEGGEKNEC